MHACKYKYILDSSHTLPCVGNDKRSSLVLPEVVTVPAREALPRRRCRA